MDSFTSEILSITAFVDVWALLDYLVFKVGCVVFLILFPSFRRVVDTHAFVDRTLEVSTPKNNKDPFILGTIRKGVDLNIALFDSICFEFISKLMLRKLAERKSSLPPRIFDVSGSVGIG